jgi:hypothetical protein
MLVSMEILHLHISPTGKLLARVQSWAGFATVISTLSVNFRFPCATRQKSVLGPQHDVLTWRNT